MTSRTAGIRAALGSALTLLSVGFLAPPLGARQVDPERYSQLRFRHI